MNAPGRPKTYLNLREVADLVEVSYSGIKRLQSRGELPQPSKLGSLRRRWHRAAIVDWLEGRAGRR